MDFVFGNLPNGVEEADIKHLVKRYRLIKMKFFANNHIEHSLYECVVSLDIKNPVAGNILESHLNNTCWKGSRISVHRLIF